MYDVWVRLPVEGQSHFQWDFVGPVKLDEALTIAANAKACGYEAIIKTKQHGQGGLKHD